MCPSSRSWPPKSNRDTGRTLGCRFTIRGFTVVVVRNRMGKIQGATASRPEPHPIKRSS
jgi:hypothetical protein